MPASGLVMLCDVDLCRADATRTHTVELASAFADSYDRVDLLARGRAHEAVDGVDLWSVRADDTQRLLRLATLNARACALLWRRRGQASHFYVRGGWSCLPAIAFARALSYRVVSQVDGIPFGEDPTRSSPRISAALRRLAAALAGRLSHGTRAVTPQIASLLAELARVPRERIAVVPNGVDTDFFRPLDRREAIARTELDEDYPGATYVVYCGGLHAWNDFGTLLRAMAETTSRHPEVRLLILGDGEEKAAIERDVRELGLGDRVVLTGAVHDRERVRDHLAAATVTVLPYRAEVVSRTSASPIKLLEYMASGRGVIAFDYPGVRALLEESGAGIAVEGTVEAFAAGLDEMLIGDRADEHGTAGRHYAEQHLTWRGVVERILPLFEV